MKEPPKQDTLLVVPVYNHGKTLAAVVESALATGRPVLVVDDGSTDGGPEALQGLSCMLLRHTVNLGKGAAILAGAREAARLGFQAIVTIDADGQHDPGDAELLIEKASAVDGPVVVIGARRMVQETVPKASLFGRSFSNFWVRVECGLDLADTQSGFRLYPVRELLRLHLTKTKYDFEIEALVKSAWAGIPIATVPVSVHYPEAADRISHFDQFKDNLRLTVLHTRLVTRRLLTFPRRWISPGSKNTSGRHRIKERLELLGHRIFYLTLRLFGHRGASLLLRPVVFSYVLFSRKIHRTTGPYLTRRFPDHGRVQRCFDTLKNVLSFGQALVDRAWLGCVPNASLDDQVVGRERIEAVKSAGKGAILLTAHVGNWQTALANLHVLKVPVHALMQYDRQAAARHYFDLGRRKRTFNIIDADGPFGGMVEAAAALQRGEFVTIMGDRSVKGPTATVNFFGGKAKLPTAAYTLAAHVGAPIIVFLAAKTGRKSYRIEVYDIFTPQFAASENRSATLTRCSQKFAEALEKYLKIFPYQWYNFFDFWSC